MIELGPVQRRVGELDMVIISPNDPEAMLRHTEECRERGYAFAADPSQQLAWSDGDAIRRMIDGATYLLSNEYEAALTEKKTGWTAEEILDRVGTRVVTLGPAGVRIERKGYDPIVVGALPDVPRVEPTGVGDAFRSGFLGAVVAGLSLERAAQIGCVLAAYVIEQVGTQEYSFTHEAFVARLRKGYGDEAADEAAGLLLATV
jgi:adenosine kinase